MTHASLFSGIGGFDLAAERLGWTNLFNCEINPICRRVLDYHFPNVEAYTDIMQADFRKWNGKVDVLSGGFPCQPFSVAGHRNGEEDERYLWPQMLRCIEECQPTWIVAENVVGLLSMTQLADTSSMVVNEDLFGNKEISTTTTHEFTIDKILSSIEELDYSVATFVIPACAIGAPHRRDRVWIVACREGGQTTQKRKDEPTKEISNNFWDNFPSHFPLLGNDNIPRELDDISFPRWRLEAVKALGNAIVPGVAIEIFKAIQKVSNKQL
ncbi:DNA (cytosine-5-)-methyltransferase [Porphyromonas somerae]|uniref:DNA cytosine methyltransferase n=1 Tax=Porphyromonas somerae TaxID=322095 RepID=UPI002A7FA1F5|nr:DNA (cytosine-5-)-methyltransferase [Porphyromonas somerae]MDY3884827.1 DNA (cytosine-5-)-methyltransferase [Porphyromonas somerae]